jgi:hypothetical protein
MILKEKICFRRYIILGIYKEVGSRVSFIESALPFKIPDGAGCMS